MVPAARTLLPDSGRFAARLPAAARFAALGLEIGLSLYLRAGSDGAAAPVAGACGHSSPVAGGRGTRARGGRRRKRRGAGAPPPDQRGTGRGPACAKISRV